MQASCRRSRRLLSVLSAIASAGCAAPAPRAGTASLLVRPEFGAATYRVQGAVAPYTESSVDHAVFKLFTLADQAETEVPGAAKDLARAALASGVPFDGLAPGATYRVRAFAFRTAGTASADQISVDASSSVDVAVVRDDRPPLTTLPVQLRGDTFAGQASTSVAVSEGSVTNEPGGVTFTVASPTPKP
jgi:hypothetical protein